MNQPPTPSTALCDWVSDHAYAAKESAARFGKDTGNALLAEGLRNVGPNDVFRIFTRLIPARFDEVYTLASLDDAFVRYSVTVDCFPPFWKSAWLTIAAQMDVVPTNLYDDGSLLPDDEDEAAE